MSPMQIVISSRAQRLSPRQGEILRISLADLKKAYQLTIAIPPPGTIDFLGQPDPHLPENIFRVTLTLKILDLTALARMLHISQETALALPKQTTMYLQRPKNMPPRMIEQGAWTFLLQSLAVMPSSRRGLN